MPYDPKIDILLIYLKEVGIDHVDNSNKNYCYVIFKDNTTVNFRRKSTENSWGSDKKTRIRWMNDGNIRFNKNYNEERGRLSVTSYNWTHHRPSWETIFKFKIICLKQDLKAKLEYRKFIKKEKKAARISKKRRKIEIKAHKKELQIKQKKDAQVFFEQNIPLKVHRKLKLDKINKNTE